MSGNTLLRQVDGYVFQKPVFLMTIATDVPFLAGKLGGFRPEAGSDKQGSFTHFAARLPSGRIVRVTNHTGEKVSTVAAEARDIEFVGIKAMAAEVKTAFRLPDAKVIFVRSPKPPKPAQPKGVQTVKPVAPAPSDRAGSRHLGSDVPRNETLRTPYRRPWRPRRGDPATT